MRNSCYDCKNQGDSKFMTKLHGQILFYAEYHESSKIKREEPFKKISHS